MHRIHPRFLKVREDTSNVIPLQMPNQKKSLRSRDLPGYNLGRPVPSARRSPFDTPRPIHRPLYASYSSLPRHIHDDLPPSPLAAPVAPLERDPPLGIDAGAGQECVGRVRSTILRLLTPPRCPLQRLRSRRTTGMTRSRSTRPCSPRTRSPSCPSGPRRSEGRRRRIRC